MSLLLSTSAVRRRSREAVVRASRRMIFAVPEQWRGRVATTLPQALVPPEMHRGFFDHYFDAGDPFGFDRNPAEQLKFSRTLEVCGDGGLGRVLELGCAVGTFTEMLAPRADEVVAVDVAQGAVDQAQRLRAHPHVTARAMSIPAELPEGPFDLVVASDVLYYLTVAELQRCVDRIEESLEDGGVLVAVHYVPRMGSVLNGDEAHDVITACTSLRQELAERTDFGAGRTYRVDRFVKV